MAVKDTEALLGNKTGAASTVGSGTSDLACLAISWTQKARLWSDPTKAILIQASWQSSINENQTACFVCSFRGRATCWRLGLSQPDLLWSSRVPALGFASCCLSSIVAPSKRPLFGIPMQLDVCSNLFPGMMKLAHLQLGIAFRLINLLRRTAQVSAWLLPPPPPLTSFSPIAGSCFKQLLMFHPHPLCVQQWPQDG